MTNHSPPTNFSKKSWVRNPEVLLKEAQFLPRDDMSSAQKFTALARLFIVLAILFAAATASYYPLIGGVVMLIILALIEKNDRCGGGGSKPTEEVAMPVVTINKRQHPGELRRLSEMPPDNPTVTEKVTWPDQDLSNMVDTHPPGGFDERYFMDVDEVVAQRQFQRLPYMKKNAHVDAITDFTKAITNEGNPFYKDRDQIPNFVVYPEGV